MIINKNKEVQLIEKLLRNEATLEEKKILSETEAMQDCMEKQWKQGDATTTDIEKEERIWKSIKECCEKPVRKYGYKIYWKWIAACAAILLIVGGIMFVEGQKQNMENEYHEVYAGGYRLLMLPDSSKIWLQPGSTVRYARSFAKQRNVWLKGDAVFEVAHQVSNPFRVYIDKTFVEVKGTVFRVNNRNTHDEVTLFNGRIDLHTQSTGKTVSMIPNQQAIIDSSNMVKLKDINCMEWENGRYTFNEMRLDSLISTINDMYEMQTVLSKEISINKLFSGSIYYYENDPLSVIRKICYNLNLEYRMEGKQATIYKP